VAGVLPHSRQVQVGAVGRLAGECLLPEERGCGGQGEELGSPLLLFLLVDHRLRRSVGFLEAGGDLLLRLDVLLGPVGVKSGGRGGRDLGSWKWNLSSAVFRSTRHLLHLRVQVRGGGGEGGRGPLEGVSQPLVALLRERRVLDGVPHFVDFLAESWRGGGPFLGLGRGRVRGR
jgi:hypothetical protein